MSATFLPHCTPIVYPVSSSRAALLLAYSPPLNTTRASGGTVQLEQYSQELEMMELKYGELQRESSKLEEVGGPHMHCVLIWGTGEWRGRRGK